MERRRNKLPNRYVVNQFQKDITHDGTRYITELPFKPDHESVSDNYIVCKKRWQSLRRSLANKGILDKYNSIFCDDENMCIIERVPLSEIPKEVDKVYYLSHRPVVRHDKETTKIRTVFDASCSVDGPCVNQCLYSGPNLLAKIFDILSRFRLKIE